MILDAAELYHMYTKYRKRVMIPVNNSSSLEAHVRCMYSILRLWIS